MINTDRKPFENIWLYIHHVIFNKMTHPSLLFPNKMSSVVFKKHNNTLLIFLYGREKKQVKISYFAAADAESIADSLWELKKECYLQAFFIDPINML